MSEFLLDRASDVARRQRCRDSTRASAAQQGTEVSGRSAQGGGDRRRHARRRRSCARPPPTRPDRALVASRAADPRGARPDRGRSRSAPRLAPDPAWQGWAPPRGRLGRVGMGGTPALARAAARASGRCLALRITGTTCGRHWSSAAARAALRRTAAAAGVRRRFAPHQLRHAHAVEMAREGVPLIVIQRQLGHSNLGITSVYLQGIDSDEIIETVHARRAPMIPVSASVRL